MLLEHLRFVYRTRQFQTSNQLIIVHSLHCRWSKTGRKYNFGTQQTYDNLAYQSQILREDPLSIVPLEVTRTNGKGGSTNAGFSEDEDDGTKENDVYRKQLNSFLKQTHLMRADMPRVEEEPSPTPKKSPDEAKQKKGLLTATKEEEGSPKSVSSNNSNREKESVKVSIACSISTADLFSDYLL